MHNALTEDKFISALLQYTKGAGLFTVFWLSLLQFPSNIVSTQIDVSAQAACGYFAKENFQFGRDIYFSRGPLAYLVEVAYTGNFFRSYSLCGEMLFSLCSDGYRRIHLFH